MVKGNRSTATSPRSQFVGVLVVKLAEIDAWWTGDDVEQVN